MVCGEQRQGVSAMIKKLKDIFYDFNDILVAMIIIAAAGLIITASIDSIMAYPASISGEIEVSGREGPTNYAENPPIADPDSDAAGGSGDGGTGADGQTDDGQIADGEVAGGNTGQDSTGGGVSGNPGTGDANGPGSSGVNGPESGTPVNISVSIPSGSSGDRIADILVGAGLVKDRWEFNQAVAAAGAEGKLRAGDFVIPSDATPAEIISILTR